MNQLFLLEDDDSLTEGLVYALRRQEFLIQSAGTVEEARRLLFPAHPYDLLILDVTLSDGSGFDVCREIRAGGDHVPILFLTASDEETSIIRGLEGGGDDYMTKPFRLGELCSRIRALLRRSKLADQEAAPPSACISRGPVIIEPMSCRAYLNGEPLDLTGMEYRLLSLFLNHPGQVLTRSLILDRLWDGNGCFVDDNTLSVYIRRLREKIEQDPSRPEHLLTVRGFGYRWEDSL